MRRRLAALLGMVGTGAVLAMWLAAAPIVSAGDPCYHGFEMPSDTTSTDTEIKLAPCAFSPTVTNVAVGATVTFLNGPEFAHLITGANQSWGSRDVEIQPGKKVSYQFDKAGVYPYACALHRGMAGVIVVGEPAVAVAAGSSGRGTTSGTTTTGSGTSTGTGSTAAAPASTSTAATTPSTSSAELAAIAAISAGVGLLVGAGVAWFALRRRSSHGKEPVAGVA